jgi:hypothetical protein
MSPAGPVRRTFTSSNNPAQMRVSACKPEHLVAETLPPLGGHSGQQCVLVREVAAGRTSAHTDLSTHFPQGHRGGAAVVEKTCRTIEQGAACSCD